MMNQIICAALIFSAFYSCSNPVSEQVCSKTIKIDHKKANLNNLENFLIEDIKLIPLSKNSKILINQIGKMKIVKNTIVISDLNTHKIFFFSYPSGEILGVIDSKGRGPEEYLRIDDFFVDKNLNFIEILDGSQKKILRYSLNGEFLKSINLPYSFSSITKINENFVFSKGIAPSNNQWMYQLIITDQELNILKKHVKIEKNKSIDIVFAPKNPLQNIGKSINFQPIYLPTIYSLDENLNLELKYCLDFSGAWLNNELAYNKKGLKPFDHMRNIYKSGKVYFVNFLEGDNHAIIYFNLDEDNDLYICIYNITSEKSQIQKASFTNLCLGSEYTCFYDDYFISVKDPLELKEYLEKNPEKLDDNLKSVIKESEESDNPLLLLTKFKQ